MRAIIQHNFNSGLGDCLVAITEYVETSKQLKKIGYNVDLDIITNENKYYKGLQLFDLFDSQPFNVFNKIEYINKSKKEYPEFINKHISYGATSPGVHWWDLFTDNKETINIITFPQNNLGFSNIYTDITHIKPAINLNIDFLQQKPFISIYCRFFDHNKDISLLTKNINLLDERVSKIDTNIFICSNNYEAKHYLTNRYTDKAVFLTLPMENDLGCHFNSHYGLSEDLAKKRTEMTIQEMFILAQSSEIFFLTEWNRVSNFLFPAYINNVPINNILCQ